jgi:hypothetical protein
MSGTSLQLTHKVLYLPCRGRSADSSVPMSTLQTSQDEADSEIIFKVVINYLLKLLVR